MSYSDFEYSVQDGNPVLRVLFVQGDTEYRYTTEDSFVSDSNYTWEPIPAKFGKVSQTNELAKDPLKIVIPRDNAFAQLFLGGVPEQITSVTLFRGHRSDTAMEFRTHWKGRVAGVSIDGDAVTIECENIFTSMRRPGLRARYQKRCRHALYGRGCGIHDYDFAVPAVVTAVDSVTVTLEADSDNSGNIYTGGMIETGDGFKRYITYHSGNTLTMIRPFPSLEEFVNDSTGYATVTLYPGCNHTMSDCQTRFNNLNNFGGYPWIPGKNPFGNSVNGSIV